jgi:hypothetical protein
MLCWFVGFAGLTWLGSSFVPGSILVVLTRRCYSMADGKCLPRKSANFARFGFIASSSHQQLRPIKRM